MKRPLLPSLGLPFVVSAVLAVATVGVVIGLLSTTTTPQVSDTAQAEPTNTVEPTNPVEPTSTREPLYMGEPILTAEEAISKTLQRFPEGHDPHSEVARLISFQSFQQSFMNSPLFDDGYRLDLPVWLVGILGNNLTRSDTLDIPGEGVGVAEDPTPVDGMFYAWDATTGFQVGSGGLISTESYSYDALVSLPDEQLPIVRPTIPYPPTLTPSP